MNQRAAGQIVPYGLNYEQPSTERTARVTKLRDQGWNR